jgi:hypothetical protein
MSRPADVALAAARGDASASDSGGDNDADGTYYLLPLDEARDGARSSSGEDEEDDDKEGWSIPESAITFTREGWERCGTRVQSMWRQRLRCAAQAASRCAR